MHVDMQRKQKRCSAVANLLSQSLHLITAVGVPATQISNVALTATLSKGTARMLIP